MLQDHFRPPLSTRRHWHAFHNAWATYISSDLNQRLPKGYFAEANVQFNIEIDVAAFDEDGGPSSEATAWLPPEPVLTVPLTLLTEVAEILIFASDGGPTLAGAVELVSPANKDRAAHRNAFVSKCAAYLQQGVGLVLIDVVTERRGNLHDELLARLLVPDPVPLGAELYAVSYRPVRQEEHASLAIWPAVLAVGQALPTLPLGLRGGLCLPLDLGTTYSRTCTEQRVTVNGT